MSCNSRTNRSMREEPIEQAVFCRSQRQIAGALDVSLPGAVKECPGWALGIRH